MWQDIVMTIGQFVFAFSLIPTIIGKEKPAWTTCMLSAIVLTIYIPTLYTLGLYISVVATILVAIGWWILFFQSMKNKSQKENKMTYKLNLNKYSLTIWGAITLSILSIIVAFLLVLASLFGGLIIDEQVAINCAEIQGFTEIEVIEKAWFVIFLRGGGQTDSARFKMKAINSTGKKVEFYVFAGWPFKSATIRTY